MKDRNLIHSDNWATPAYLYDELNNEFNFDFDPCPLNHDITKWNGLEVEWGTRNFINPPYSDKKPFKLKTRFVQKAIDESVKGKLCVMLLPVSTSTELFHEYIKPNADKITFIRSRVKFCGINTKGKYVTNNTPMHDSMIVIFDGRAL